MVVGDVVGRGIVAAATMGQLRSAVRALASTGLTPGPLLDALDSYARRHEVGQMTTLAYAELDLDSGVLVLACAGHPPPAMTIPTARHASSGTDARRRWMPPPRCQPDPRRR